MFKCFNYYFDYLFKHKGLISKLNHLNICDRTRVTKLDIK